MIASKRFFRPSAAGRLLLVAMIACVASAWGQPGKREPHIGYLYPAGGQQGAVVQITAGGQFLKAVSDVYVTGEGVRATVIRHYKPVRNIQREQRLVLEKRLRGLEETRLIRPSADGRAAEMSGEEDVSMAPEKEPARGRKKPARKGAGKRDAKKKQDAAPVDSTAKKGAKRTGLVKPVEHPLLRDLDGKSLRELHHVAHQLFFPRWKKQINAQIDEMVLIEMAIEPDAAPGDRELRLGTSAGLTNPMCFQVGPLPEVCELEPNDPNAPAKPNLPKAPPIDVPVLLNGQIMPGDIDRFCIRAKRGQQLVIAAQARRLIPYLADAVPGWFQATLALYDTEGNELAFADDYRFNPDPVLFYAIPEDGEYTLEIRDAIYRGREDFVYRIAVGELPFITQAFPLGGRTGVETVASIDGWNLAKTQLPLDTQPGGQSIRQTTLRQGPWVSNEVAYAVDTLPECNETEPNDTARHAQRIDLPQIVNGRIAQPGDVDVFQFEGRAGDDVVAEVVGRRLHSPLDSLLRLTDASGRVLEWNDDDVHKDGHLHTDSGLLTHHADSRLRVRLPEDGVYCVQLSDSQRRGGEAYAYRLRVAPPQPDFALRVTPSSINVPVGRAAALCVHALRKDGFDGEIELVLKDAPPGFVLNGGRIPPGRDRARMTLTAPLDPLDQPVVLRLEGRARIGGQTVKRPVFPSEDMMQAFLYRHLAPSQELMVAVTGAKRQGRAVELASSDPVRIPAGGTVRVRVKTPRSPTLKDIQLELSEPPEGVTLQDVTALPNGLAFTLEADGDTVQAGFADNLIVEASMERVNQGQGGNAANQKRRVSLGVLPAIPFEIVEQ